MDHAERPDDARAAAIARREDLGQRVEGLVLRAAVGVDERAGGRAKLRATNGVADEGDDHVLELAWRAHLDGRVLREKAFRNLGEVVHVRPEDDRTSMNSRLEDVVAAQRHEAPADEDRGRDLIQLRKLTDRVKNHRVDLRLTVDWEIAATRCREAFALAEAFSFAEPLGMARGEDQQRIASCRRHAKPVERANHGVLFAFRRASRDEHRTPGRHAEESKHTLATAAWRGRRIERIEFQAAGHGDTSRVGAKPREAARHLLALHAELVDIGEDPLDEGKDDSIMRIRTWRRPDG